MKKFRYRLQALLKVKEQIEKDRQKQLAAVSVQVHSQERRLEEVDESREQTIERQRNQLQNAFSVAEMLVISRYLQKLKRDTVTGQELIKALRNKEDEKRHDLLKATRERKKYEKLKEHQRQEHHGAFESALTKENDETAINTYLQKERAGRSRRGLKTEKNSPEYK